jgi:hypothetical protein
MFKWRLRYYKVNTKVKLYPLTNWNPIDWVRLSFCKFKKFDVTKAVSFVGKFVQNFEGKYTIFKSNLNNVNWMLGNDGVLCTFSDYGGGFIKRIYLYYNWKNENDIIRTCKKYAFKHDYYIAIEFAYATVSITLVGKAKNGLVVTNLNKGMGC